MKEWELHISAKFEQNSENKESAYQIYIKSIFVIMHMFERLNEFMGYSGYIWTL